MKKLLIIALLFVGCDYAPTEHEHDTTHEHDINGICVEYDSGHYSENAKFTCYNYPELTHKDCIISNIDIFIYAWYTDINCEEFCEGRLNVNLQGNPADSIPCYIQDEIPVFDNP